MNNFTSRDFGIEKRAGFSGNFGTGNPGIREPSNDQSLEGKMTQSYEPNILERLYKTHSKLESMSRFPLLDSALRENKVGIRHGIQFDFHISTSYKYFPFVGGPRPRRNGNCRRWRSSSRSPSSSSHSITLAISLVQLQQPFLA